MTITPPLGMSPAEWQAGVDKFARAFAKLSPEQTIKVNMADIAASNVASLNRATKRMMEAEAEAKELNVAPTAHKPWISALYLRKSACGQVVLSLRNWREEFGCSEKEAVKQIAEVVRWLEDHKEEYGLSFHCAIEHLPMAEAMTLAPVLFNELYAQTRALSKSNKGTNNGSK